MTKSEVKLSKVGIAPNPPIPALVFAGTFDNHMQFGDRDGTCHGGLHLIGGFRKADDQRLALVDLTVNSVYAGRIATGTGNPAPDRAATVTIKEVDPRANTFSAEVNIYGTGKASTFFPIGTSLDQAKNYIRAAYRDACTYGSSQYGGGDVDIYKEMRAKFRLNWIGMATINGQEI